MIEHRRHLTIFSHTMLVLGLGVVLFPLYICLVTASLDQSQISQMPLPLLPSTHFWENIVQVWTRGVSNNSAPLDVLLMNSFIMAMAITIGKIAVSILSSFAIVYFRFPLRSFFFGIIFLTLMLPVEVRIFPTVDIVANLGLMNSYAGLTLPLMASATATFLFRQFFMSLPYELVEAARIDGASPMRFFRDIILPLSKTNIAALFVITFIYGWNQYLWPLLIVNDTGLGTAVAAVKSMMPSGDDVPMWHTVMAATALTMLPALVIMLVMQRWFVRGLVDSEK